MPPPGPTAPCWTCCTCCAARRTASPRPCSPTSTPRARTRGSRASSPRATLDDAACDAAVARFPLAHAERALAARQPQGPRLVGHVRPAGHDPEPGRVVAAPAVRGDGRVLVQPPQHHLPEQRRSGRPAARTTGTSIRAHALGRFSDMLVASVTQPGDAAVPRQPQEPRAPRRTRTTAARCSSCTRSAATPGTARPAWSTPPGRFTGLTVLDPWNGRTPARRSAPSATARTGTDVGPLQVLGWSHPNDEPRRAASPSRESLMRYLAVHPATAAAHRPQARRPLRLRTTRRRRWSTGSRRSTSTAGTAVVPVLRALFASPEFAAAAGAKYAPAVRVARRHRSAPSASSPSADAPDRVDPPARRPARRARARAARLAPAGRLPRRRAALVRHRHGARPLERQRRPRRRLVDRGPDPPRQPACTPGCCPASRRPAAASSSPLLHGRLMPGRALADRPPRRARRLPRRRRPGPQRRHRRWLFPVLTALLLDSPAWSLR